MPRPRSAKFEAPTGRLRLPVRGKPYTAAKLAHGLLLLYRRNKGPGTWAVRVCRNDEDWVRQIGIANDHDAEDGKNFLSYWQATDEAKRIANTGKPSIANAVKAALDDYKANLESRNGGLDNITRVLAHLPGRLADKAVAMLADDDLIPFRDTLLTKMKRNSSKRTITVLKAALNFVADRDGISRRPWNGPALKIKDSTDPPNNVILDDHDRRAVRAAAHQDSEEFGLLIEVLDETGARASQAVRLTGADVQVDFIDPRTGRRTPRLMMPVSRKGRGAKQVTHRPVPITAALADKLKGRSGVLLKRTDGRLWSDLPHYFDAAVKGVKFNNPAKVTLYSLRHTSIVRQLLAGVPIRIVAVLHDTSTAMIEKTYSAFIADHADELARATLPAAPEIVSLDDHRAKA